jgi:hypothetical protein
MNSDNTVINQSSASASSNIKDIKNSSTGTTGSIFNKDMENN